MTGNWKTGVGYGVLLILVGCGTEKDPSLFDGTRGDAGENDSVPGDGGETDARSATDADGETAKETWPEGKYISMTVVFEKSEGGQADMALLNVSDEAFYEMGHIEGSLKIPWDTLFENLGALEKNRHIVIYCHKGVRSESAYDTLIGAGYSHVWVMDGGLESWIAAGYSVVSD